MTAEADSHVSFREAGWWTAFWIALALAVAAGIFLVRGTRAGVEFLSGYLIEYALSVDNIFVFLLIFSYFGTERRHQLRVLRWGILGALLMRGVMITGGVALLQRFEWVTYLFGAFLMVTGVRMGMARKPQIDPEASPILRFVRHIIPVSDRPHGNSFFVRTPDARGRLWIMATPLFITLILVETTDLVFAVDSIPAIFAVTRDPFIIYTSNVCAILGLRSLYFLLAGAIDRFRYLHYGLAVVLAFVGGKMLAAKWYSLSTGISLAVICVILVVTVVWSLMASGGTKHGGHRPAVRRTSDVGEKE